MTGQWKVEDEQILVSVVIVTYNGLEYLDACLSSVLDQGFPAERYQVIAVDNASSDGSADFIEENYPSVRVVRLERNYGPNGAIHRALPYLCGTYYAYLHQDTVVHRRWLAELVEALDSDPQAALVESNVILPGCPEYDVLSREALPERAYVCDVNSFGVHEFRTVPVTPNSPPIPVLAAYGPSILVNQRFMEELGFFLDPNIYLHADDLDVGLRLNIAGYHTLLAPRSVVYHETDRWHFKWDVRSALKAFYSTRNIVLVFYQISYPWEFLCLLPRMMYGKLLKAGENCRTAAKRVLYELAAVPLVLVCLLSALLCMPAYRERRRLTLSRRKMPRGWLIEQFQGINWTAVPLALGYLADRSEDRRSAGGMPAT